MNILVLSLTKKLRKPDKTEYLDKFEALKSDSRSVEVKEIFDNAVLLEHELKKAAKAKPDLIIVSGRLKNENAFRQRFAFIIRNAERKIQSVPKAKKKGFRKKGEEIKTVSYSRKKTHVFTLETDAKPAYTFNLGGIPLLSVDKKLSGKELSRLIDRVGTVFEENSEAYPDGYSEIQKSKRVLTFFERHFPIRSDSHNEKIRKSAMLAALCVFVVAAYIFVNNMFIIPMHNSAIISDIQTIFYEGTDSKSGSDKNKIAERNWNKLEKINKEIVGWVKINNTKIDYPILWHKEDTADSQYYLWRNYNQEYYQGGTTSIFMDWRSKKGMNSRNVILHGHHMEDGSMFTDLLKYGSTSGNLEFYKKSPVVYISTKKGGTVPYKIISVFKSNVDSSLGEYFDFYCGSFKNDAQYLNYIYNLRIRSLINCPVSVNEKDQLLSLVTCSYEFGDGSNFRTCIVARKCRKGESAEVDTGSASLNKNAVWPQCYYSRYGGTRPTVSTFRTEYKKGKLSWYDGNYSGKGSEQLPTSYTIPTEPPTETTKATTKPKTSSSTSSKVKKKTTCKVSIFTRDYNKAVKTKTVKINSSFKLPKVKTYTKNGYRFVFKNWVARYGSKSTKLSSSVTKVVVETDTRLYAKYKRIKLKKVTPTSSTSATKPTKPTKATEPEKPEEPEEPDVTEPAA